MLFFSLFWVRFFGLLGMRATYGTINNGIGVVLMGMMRPEMKMKCALSQLLWLECLVMHILIGMPIDIIGDAGVR